MTIDIDKVPYKSASVGTNDASNIVADKYRLMENLVDQWENITEQGVNKLTEIYETAQMPNHEIDWSFIESGLPTIRDQGMPEIPDLPEMEYPDIPTVPELGTVPELNIPDVPEAPGVSTVPSAPNFDAVPTAPDLTSNALPQVGDLKDVSIKDFDIPDYQFPDEPDAAYAYTELPYNSELLDAVRAKLKDWVIDGGTGLDADIENMIWERSKARLELQRRRAWDDTLERFSSRGFTIPPGALGSALDNVILESNRAEQQLNYEISIEQARLAQNNTHFAVTSSNQNESMMMSLHNSVYARALQNAKQAVEMIFYVYKSKVEGYITKLRAHELEANVHIANINAAVGYNNNKATIFRAKLDGYNADANNKIRVFETAMAAHNAKADNELKTFQAKIAAHNTKTDGENKNFQSEISAFQAEIGANTSNIANTVNIFNAKVNAYQAKVSAYQETLKTELMMIENIARVFAMKLSGFQAGVQVEVENLKARIEEFRAKVSQSNNQTQLSLQEAEMVLRNYLQKLTLQSNAATSLGNLGAQITASALSSVNTSASLGDSTGRSFGVGYSYGFSLGNSASLGESHSFDHTGAE